MFLGPGDNDACVMHSKDTTANLVSGKRHPSNYSALNCNGRQVGGGVYPKGTLFKGHKYKIMDALLFGLWKGSISARGADKAQVSYVIPGTGMGIGGGGGSSSIL